MGTLEIHFSDSCKRITKLHSSFFDTIRIGKNVVTPKDKAHQILLDSKGRFFKLFRGDQEL